MEARLSKHMVDALKDKLCYDHAQQKWFKFGEQYWEETTEDIAAEMIFSEERKLWQRGLPSVVEGN